MHPWQAFILGLVEGITEFLPVSSTGHLIIASSLLGLDDDPARKSAVDAFNIVIQGGAILAVLVLYWPRVLQLLRGIAGRDHAGRRLFTNLVIAFIPAAVLGVLLDDWIEEKLFHAWPVLAALALGGVWMIWLGRGYGTRTHDESGATLTLENLTWKHALGIGLFQCVAMWPGTSRSMMTIAGGTLLGLRPAQAAEFSFLLGLPTLGGACVYKLLKNLKRAHESGAPNLIEQLGGVNVAIGLVVATVSAAIAVKWLVGFLNRRGLAPFGWYRLALTAVLAGLILMDVVAVR